MMRSSLAQVRGAVVEPLRAVYRAESRQEALEGLRRTWGSRYLVGGGDSAALRSTNLMERFIREIRRSTRVRDHKFPRSEAVFKAGEPMDRTYTQRLCRGRGDARTDAEGAVLPLYTDCYI